MKRKIMTIVLLLLLSLLMVTPISAGGRRLVDDASLLRENEASRLENQLDEISQRQQLDVIIVTVESLEGQRVDQFNMDFFERYNYGVGPNRDGVIFLIAMAEREFDISTHGFGITAFTDAGLEIIESRVVSDLSAGNYARAFATFANYADDFITQARAGRPVDRGNLPAEPFPLFWIPVAIIIGMIIAFIIVLGMRSSMKSVRQQRTACNYVRANSLRITRSKDIFLFRNIRRVPRAQNNNNSKGGGSTIRTSSSGGSFGGRSGRF